MHNALNNKFENKRRIVNSHTKSLLMLDNIPFESAEKLRMLIGSVLKHVRALKVMNLEINNLSESLLKNIISQKLDKICSKEFKVSLMTIIIQLGCIYIYKYKKT